MTVKEKESIKNLLSVWGGYKYILRCERSELRDIKDMRDSMTDIKAITYDFMPKDNRLSKPVKNGIINSINLCEGRIEKLNRLIKSNMENKENIDRIVDKLPYVEQYILKGRYVDKISWEAMPFHLPFEMSKRHCQRYHDAAIETIYNELLNDKSYKKV